MISILYTACAIVLAFFLITVVLPLLLMTLIYLGAIIMAVLSGLAGEDKK